MSPANLANQSLKHRLYLRFSFGHLYGHEIGYTFANLIENYSFRFARQMHYQD